LGVLIVFCEDHNFSTAKE